MDELEELARLEAMVQRQLRINFKPYAQIYYWTQAAKGEVSGWGKARLDENGVYTVTEIVLLEQECSSGFTDFTDEAITDFLFWCGKYKKDPSEYNFWWHSHCQMGTFWSGTDQGTMAMYSQKQPFIALVTNKRGDMLAQYNFQGETQTMTIAILPTGHQEIQKECYQEVADKVKEPPMPDFTLEDEASVEGCGNHQPQSGVKGVVTRVPQGCGPVIIRSNGSGYAGKKTEKWDYNEDRWKNFCGSCGTQVGKEQSDCPECGVTFTETVRT